MSGYVIDSSVYIAILNAEEGVDDFKIFLDRDASCRVSAATLHESFCVSRRAAIADGAARLEQIVELVGADVVAFDAIQLDVAKSAYSRFGRGSGHKAGLNMGDCFSYALAKTRNLPLLFKGDDFVHTDVEPALKPL
ncbi:type II toxin-antitoxin system VapC family toxin [Mesorhizobium sp. ASY16-5R]|uniref:type II toxin-antitoxin system VapC family toxin n=1 Tax=Mesorhizobium sp. ASY16-5R TaxID=3445772 RepID=UPI003F9FDCFC